MQYFRKVLVGVPAPEFDESGRAVPDPPSRAALEQAIHLAKASSCSLTLMSVVAPPSAGFLSSDEENEKFAARILEEAKDALAAVAAGLDSDGIELDTRVETGQAWHALCAAVLRDGFDLVIAGTRNVGALQRLIFGGTGLRLLRNCPCPVWIVKPQDDAQEGPLDVLVATQLDDVGQQALNLAVDGSTILDARIHVLHAIEFEPARRLGMNAEEAERYRDKVRAVRTEELREAISQTDYRTAPHGVTPMVVEGRPYLCILDAIEHSNVDLLIMGTLGRGGLPGALVGNTAERLLTEVSCSILAIKPNDFECPVKLEGQGSE